MELAGCTYIHTKDGHEKWRRSGLFRPIIIQSHIDPLPERIARNLIKLLGLSREDYHEILEGREVARKVGERWVVRGSIHRLEIPGRKGSSALNIFVRLYCWT